ncbi:hypothetical protein MYX84_13860, partial [Acidobacteria bacterium AH-259-O06]|nr:hypothetical protein [Acidobacteria bacterium AH-259-O06]
LKEALGLPGGNNLIESLFKTGKARVPSKVGAKFGVGCLSGGRAEINRITAHRNKNARHVNVDMRNREVSLLRILGELLC